jgi:hypothetical protein
MRDTYSTFDTLIVLKLTRHGEELEVELGGDAIEDDDDQGHED